MSDDRDFGFVFREDGIFHVFVTVDDETGDKVKAREEPVTGDQAVELARLAVDAADADELEELLAGGTEPGAAVFQLRYPDAAERQADYDEAVAAEMARRDDLAKEGITL